MATVRKQENNIKIPKVIRVTRYEFELDNGQVFQHPEPLEEAITIEEFQVFYEHWYRQIMELNTNDSIVNTAASLQKAWCQH